MADAPLTAAALGGVPHGFSTRAGLAAGDILAGARLVRVRQVHSADVVPVADDRWDAEDAPEADALVTDRRGVALAIVTADCAPVLLADARAGVVGAAHAGWRGALAGIIDRIVAAMVALGAAAPDIVAAIGPTIAQPNYEVDAGFRARFLARDSGFDRFFAPGRAGHFHYDLPAFVHARLIAAGVGRVEDMARDTYAEEAVFHSYRRASHRGRQTAGRQISAIAIG